MHHFVVRLVLSKTVPEILLHAFAVRQTAVFHSAVSPDQNVRPNRRPVIGILLRITIIVEQSIDQIELLVGRLVLCKVGKLVIARNSAYQIQKQVDGTISRHLPPATA